jgi:6-phosphogluconolactonase/glucosamine-6-phosphate isomerase/deaminase
MTAGTEVHLVELYTYSQEFISIRDKIQQTLPVDVSRVLRVQNPYLYGTYDIAITSNLIRHAEVTPCHVNGRGKDSSVHTILHGDFHRT